MIPANQPIQRPSTARLLVVDAAGTITDAPRSHLVELLRPGDLVVANDAATVPASLEGVHLASGGDIEVRLAGWIPDLNVPVFDHAAGDVRFKAVVFGSGNYRIRTEDRPLPPALHPGDRLALGSLVATVERLLDHPRFVSIRFDGTWKDVWAGLGRHGRPIQYAHVPDALALWDMWTPIAALPLAFEPPSASFALDWRSIHRMRDRGIRFESITHAAGISSTGDPDLDRRLPLDEPYRIPIATAAAVRLTRAIGGRVVAVGTTVVRALEHAARRNGGVVVAGNGLADQRIGPTTDLLVVDAIVSGTHEPDSSHYELLRAFLSEETLRHASAVLDTLSYRTHEFGDSMFIERGNRAALSREPPDSGRKAAA